MPKIVFDLKLFLSGEESKDLRVHRPLLDLLLAGLLQGPQDVLEGPHGPLGEAPPGHQAGKHLENNLTSADTSLLEG